MVFAVDDLAVAPHEKEISGVVRAHLIRSPESVTAPVFKRLGLADGEFEAVDFLGPVFGFIPAFGGAVFQVSKIDGHPHFF